MSFRDLRNFTEMMRVLGYPRLISINSFRNPNFPLVAEILIWLVRRFDSEANVPTEFSTEEERVVLIRFIAELMVRTSNLKLNTKKLYQADGHAVKELLKMTTVLYDAQMKSMQTLESPEPPTTASFDISDKINDLKTAKQLSSQLTISGATLFDLLGREIELREIRNSKVASQFDTVEIEIALKEVIETTKKEIIEMKEQIENTKEMEENVEVKIERRKNELERNQKRLQALKKVRPAFMEEYDKLEEELKQLYEDYLQKFRYLSYLEHLYEEKTKAEQEKFERKQAATKKQLEQLRIDDVSNIDSNNDVNETVLNTNLQDNMALKETQKTVSEKPIDTKKSARVPVNQRRIYGSMSGRHRGPVRGTNGNGATSDSDSDLLIDNFDDDDDDEDLLTSVLDGTGTEEFTVKNSDENKRSVSKLDHTDDEF